MKKAKTKKRVRLPKASDEEKSFQRAYVTVSVGRRDLSDIIAAAGLGLTGVGVKKVWTIDYAPGEKVTKTRVRRAMKYLQDHDAEAGLKIFGFEVLRIETVKV